MQFLNHRYVSVYKTCSDKKQLPTDNIFVPQLCRNKRISCIKIFAIYSVLKYLLIFIFIFKRSGLIWNIYGLNIVEVIIRINICII